MIYSKVSRAPYLCAPLERRSRLDSQPEHDLCLRVVVANSFFSTCPSDRCVAQRASPSCFTTILSSVVRRSFPKSVFSLRLSDLVSSRLTRHSLSGHQSRRRCGPSARGRGPEQHQTQGLQNGAQRVLLALHFRLAAFLLPVCLPLREHRGHVHSGSQRIQCVLPCAFAMGTHLWMTGDLPLIDHNSREDGTAPVSGGAFPRQGNGTVPIGPWGASLFIRP